MVTELPACKKVDFDYKDWPLAAKGAIMKPTTPNGQWTAWIEAGGQHDAIVVHGPSQEHVDALRKFVLGKPNEAFLLDAIQRIKQENDIHGDSDRTSALIEAVLVVYRHRAF